ncbi:MAG: alpha-galactosidase, partial [Candidatus Dadabacteria bacterium]
PRMYTTWHADFEKLSHDGILGHLDHLKQTGLDQSINAFQIDDGYQQHWGDWLTTSAQFGTDLTTIATEIRARGFEPGLWLAPPLVAADSAIARRHPDWILRRDGRPVRCDTCNTRGIKLYVLDFGNDEVTNWLEQTMARLQDAGFSLFKLDFLATAVAVGASAATDTTGLDRFHRMLAAIRRGARPGTFLWSATQPLFPTLGALDGYRVSGDLGFPFFDDLPLANWYHYARTLALRAPWLNRWGIIDPDGFFLRGQPDASRRRTLLWLDAMAGGIYAIGDRDADLSAAHSPSALPQPLRDGIGTGVSWIPIDPFAYPIRTWTPSPVVEQLITVDRNTDAQPPFWFHRCGSDACVIAVNWAPFQRTVALPASHLTRFGSGSWTIAESWGNGTLFKSRSELRFDLPAMGAMAVRLARR